MIKDEKLQSLYELVIEGIELTTKNLSSCGFSSADLTFLIEQDKIQRIKRGYYSFHAISDLFYYGKKLIAEKEYEKSTKCFERCYELDPNHTGVCFQLFLRSINQEDYVTAFKYFEVLSNTDNPYYMANNNFYLYLLNIITEIPEKHRQYARYLGLEDIRFPHENKKYEDISLQNKIRISVLKRKFPLALKQLNDLTRKNGKSTVQDIITRTLLYQAIRVEELSKNTLLELGKTKQYDKIVSHLEGKQQRYKLSLIDYYTLKLTKKILDIKNNGAVPEKTIFEAEKLFDAIDGCNYELALQLANSYNKQNNINDSESIINLLLVDICNLINQISLSKSSNPESSAVTDKLKPLAEDPIITPTSINTSSSTFSDVIRYLIEADLENAFKCLTAYMESINKKQYEFLIIDLIKLSLLKNDTSFVEPMTALSYISRDKFNFDISTYIQDFYIALSENKFDVARIYLNILANSNKLGEDFRLTEALLQMLDTSEKMVNDKRNSTILDTLEVSIQKSENHKASSVSSPKVSNPEPVPKKNETKTDDTLEREKEFIESKHELLLKGQGIVLLRPMNSERRKVIHKIVKKYPDMCSFSIGTGEKKKIVLRYNPTIEEFIDKKELRKQGHKAYTQGNYDECINCFRKLLQFGQPPVFVYARLGLAYMKQCKIPVAIDYLTVATELTKENNDDQYDFTELIGRLKGRKQDDDPDLKPLFKMKIEDFDTKEDDYYGLENFDEITSYILETGLDVESACIDMGMNEEQIDIVRLIYAREYYIQGNHDIGEVFLKTVERSKNKTPFTKKLLEEIRKNKKLYPSRATDEEKRLALTIRPKKNKE